MSEAKYTEDELAASITTNGSVGEQSWFPEVHYNHYGDRGVVDLVRVDERDGRVDLRLYELKCVAALEEVTGANEVLRQFNRHRTYFFKGSDYNATNYNNVTFELCFAATQECYEHVRENWAQYKHISQGTQGRKKTKLLFRSPEAEYPFIPKQGGKILHTFEIDNVSDFNPEVIRR